VGGGGQHQVAGVVGGVEEGRPVGVVRPGGHHDGEGQGAGGCLEERLHVVYHANHQLWVGGWVRECGNKKQISQQL
jgi:hypothetical protein